MERPRKSHPASGAPRAVEEVDRLDSWKEIAAYLKRGVRAVQRWEKEEGLPVHRHVHKKLDSVYAFRPELDQWLATRDQREKKTSSGAAIAVLPFHNDSPDPESEYFADGLTEELINALSRIEGLRVASRTSVLQYKKRSEHVRQIGERLAVGAILEGSIRSFANRVRVSARLIRVADDSQLFSQTFDRELKDAFAIQEEIARSIVEKLEIRLRQSSSDSLFERYTENFEAYNFYLKGRQHLNRRTPEDFEKAIGHFSQAVTVDAKYAIAYSGLADCYNMLGYYSYLPAAEAFPKARAAALQALRMDDGIAEAHASLGFCKLFYEWKWLEAEKEFKQALAINSEYAMANHWYGLSLAALGRPFEGVMHVRKAWAQEPSSPVSNMYVAAGYYFARQYERAIEKCSATLDLEPGFSPARLVLGWSYRQKSMLQEAIAEFKNILRQSERNMDARAALGHVYAIAGEVRRANKVLEELKRTSLHGFVSAGHVAIVFLGLGELEEAFRWFSRALQERYPGLVFLKLDPIYDGLQSDSRFQKLTLNVGLG